MGFDPKAIVLDMDGTMLDHMSRMSTNLHQYIQQLREKGKLVFIATGRTRKEIEEITPEDLEVDGMLCANGMASYTGGRPLKEYPLPAGLVRRLVEKAGRDRIYYEVHPAEDNRVALRKDKSYMQNMMKTAKPTGVKEEEWSDRKAALQADNIAWQDELPDEKIAKIYFFHPDQDKNRQWKQELEALKAEDRFAAFSSSDHNVEVMAAGVSKAAGIEHLLDNFHLTTEDILVVGDSDNDVPLFRLAAYAVAMKNAPARVQSEADEVTEFPHTEDGLYHFLQQRFG